MPRWKCSGERLMGNFRSRVLQLFVFVLLTCTLAAPSNAETGSVKVVFTKAGLIVGVGAGRGILTLRGHQYPFKISGLGVGLMGASSNLLVGKAMNLLAPSDIAGSYGAIGVGGAVVGGVGGIRLRNERGVILELHGVKVGLEVSAAVSRVQVTME
jgi:hypothetical protein